MYTPPFFQAGIASQASRLRKSAISAPSVRGTERSRSPSVLPFYLSHTGDVRRRSCFTSLAISR